MIEVLGGGRRVFGIDALISKPMGACFPLRVYLQVQRWYNFVDAVDQTVFLQATPGVSERTPVCPRVGGGDVTHPPTHGYSSLTKENYVCMYI